MYQNSSIKQSIDQVNESANHSVYSAIFCEYAGINSTAEKLMRISEVKA